MDALTIFESMKEFMKPELAVLAPVLYCIGIWLKNWDGFSNNKIPVVLGLVGMILAGLWTAGTSEVTGVQNILVLLFVAFVQGILYAGVSVYVNQLIKQGAASG
jgi:hypothetical protein